MALLALCFPIAPGKRGQWDKFMAELSGPRYAQFEASRESMGVRERTFLQETPMGDMVLVTLEGEDPASAFAKFGAGTDEFTLWFMEQVKETHGVDLTQPPPGPLPVQIIDSRNIVKV